MGTGNKKASPLGETFLSLDLVIALFVTYWGGLGSAVEEGAGSAGVDVDNFPFSCRVVPLNEAQVAARLRRAIARFNRKYCVLGDKSRCHEVFLIFLFLKSGSDVIYNENRIKLGYSNRESAAGLVGVRFFASSPRYVLATMSPRPLASSE